MVKFCIFFIFYLFFWFVVRLVPCLERETPPYFTFLNAAHIKSERTCKILRVYLLSEVDVFAELRVLDSEKNTF